VGTNQNQVDDEGEAAVRKQRQGAFTAETPKRREAAGVERQHEPAAVPDTAAADDPASDEPVGGDSSTDDEDGT
jgi:hypothetical protein